MGIDYVYILGAGFGTRMGKLGTIIPKVLWPVFEKSVLELQVQMANSFSPKKIFLNTHFSHNKIESFIKSHSLETQIEVLHEPQILDIGGAIHNLGRKLSYQGKVLVLNGDQFYFFSENDYENIINLTEENHQHLLIGTKVKWSAGYNQLCEDQNQKLTGINQNTTPEKTGSMWTYSGCSIINLNILAPHDGESKFFDSVAIPSKDTYVYHPKEIEYWDFGTSKRYYDSIFRTLEKLKTNEKSKFINFLSHNNGIDLNLVNETSYNSKGKNNINFSSFNMDHLSNSIIIDSGSQNLNNCGAGIYLDEYFEKI